MLRVYETSQGWWSMSTLGGDVVVMKGANFDRYVD